MKKSDIMKFKPSAYRSMLLSQYGYSKPTTKANKGALQRWKDEEWLNLNALLQGEYLPCGKKYKGQKEPTVCRPRRKINEKTPKPLAEQLTKTQIKKAISKKKKGERIIWKDL